MTEAFNHEEASILEEIKAKLASVKTYKQWVTDYQKKIDDAQSALNYATKIRDGYLADIEHHNSKLLILKEKLRKLLVLPDPISVVESLTEKVTEDCVDQLESRSKSETQNAITV